MIASGFDITVCVLLCLCALAAVTGRDTFRAIVFFIVYGLLISVAWLRIDAIDVALAEAAIGAGLTGVLLLGAFGQMGSADTMAREPRGAVLIALVAGAGIGAAVLFAVQGLPPEGAGLTAEVLAQLEASGVGNPVTAVLLNFRGYDTLLESIVLLVALIGVWSVASETGWGERPGIVHHARAGGTLQSFGRFLPAIGLVIGAYIVWAGSSGPGGAFQGGTVLAAVAILTILAGLVDAPRVTTRWLRWALVMGPGVFLGVALLGLFGGAFLVFPQAVAYPAIVAIEIVLTASIALTLVLLVLGPPREAPQ
ncbi:hydrogenase subunit MbhD domain-containing protein [Pelagibacterium montanilacus]|uniref:hydrogenase subunit MbhD domain-containing protein n=1 Tax=Pelagibacterium montanilacus TaxID=2185280 RepID=UPI000F8DE4FC|nr:hydrogen gas-evolving membrane-bound hydrogenase subunit E [Pelagibacterium montanilacus]